MRNEEVGAAGFEPSQFPPRKPLVGDSGGSKTGNTGAETPPTPVSTSTPTPPAPEAPADPELAAVVAAWADLPPAVRAGIVAMVAVATVNQRVAGEIASRVRH
jgi:hypothetical protein